MRRDYVGGAQSARLTSTLGDGSADLTISCNNLTNWPTGAGGRPFYVVIDRGTASEEKILCSSRSGNTLSVYDDGVVIGRGADDTSITAHSSNAVIEHVFTATDADEANALVNLLTTTGDILVYGATGNARLPVSGNDGYILAEDSTDPNGIGWKPAETTFNIINPFLLMGA